MITINEQITQIDQEIDQLWEKESQLKSQKTQLIMTAIKESNLIAKATWELRYYPAAVYLETHTSELGEVSKLLDPGWHAYYEIEPGVVLSYDDGLVSIRFEHEELPKLLKFCQDHSLKVNLIHLKKEMTKLEEELRTKQQVWNQLSSLEATMFLSNSKDSIKASALIPARLRASSLVSSYSSSRFSFSFPRT